MLKRRIFLLLIGTLFMSFSFLSNVTISYALDGSEGNLNEDSSYYLIHYNGEEQEVVINDHVTLLLAGWANESKSSVNSKVEIHSDSVNQTKDLIMNFTDELHELSITENESIHYRLAVSDSIKVEEVKPLELNDHRTVVAENENGTSIEEIAIIDEYGTVIENQGLTYYLTNENNQKMEISKEEYDSLNSDVELSAEATSPNDQLIVSEENNSQITEENTVESVQSFSINSIANPSVVYSTHVEHYGWLDDVSDGEMSGTEGQSFRMEAIRISLGEDAPYSGGISYKTHVQSYGWLDPVSNGAISGKTGESKRMEAIQINLTGEMAEHYDVYYRVHAQSYGWLDWAKNGESAGTQGLSKRLEAIEIVLVEKGGAAPGSTNEPFIIDPSVVYSTHVEYYGWLNRVSDGELSGTAGQSKRMEAIKISLENTPYSGGITYKTHVQSYGWLDPVSNGAIAGKTGESKRMEAIQINLTGEMAKHYDVYYRVHAQSYGWLDWAKNGESAGTQGLSKRLEAIEIVLVEKGGAAPGSTNEPFIIDPSVVYSTHIQDYGWLDSVSDGETSGTQLQSKRMEAIKIALQNTPYSGGITYKTHVQSYGWLDSVSNGAISGTSRESKRMEAIQINLTGEMAKHYDVYYRVHAQSYGWLDWAKNGGSAGTEGLSKRLEAIEIVLVKKGGAAPGSTNEPFIQSSLYIAYNNYDITLNDAVKMQMNLLNTLYPAQTDKYLYKSAFVSRKDMNLSEGFITGTSVNLRNSPETDNVNNIVVKNVGSGISFKLLDDNVTGDEFKNSTRWFKIEYDQKILYVHSTLATRVGTVTSDLVNLRVKKSESSPIYGTLSKGKKLTILENDDNGWYTVRLNDWINANSADVQYYLDPNNFVNHEKLRLQFMDLTKLSGVQQETLKQYLKQYLNGKGTLDGHGQTFVEAALNNGVNEIYLLSHALLETGNGTSDLAKGILVKEVNGQPVVLKDSKGGVLTLDEVETIPDGAKPVYNMFGIGAKDKNPYELGAIAAYNNQWFSVSEAIKGGAAWIEQEYFSGTNNQNTLYEMRWNPIFMDTRGSAGNQYATDIGWATKQLDIMYELDQALQYTVYLEIPKYK